MEKKIDFSRDLEFGEMGEKLAYLSFKDAEVKSERGRCFETGNHYCEFKWNGKQSPTGITQTPCQFWIVNLFKDDKFVNAVIIPVEKLRKQIKEKKYRIVSGGDNNKGTGFLIPLKDLFGEI